MAGRPDVRPVLERLWCGALGVASVSAEDDFFALGGESLMAVALLGQVREHTAMPVAVADFTARPTFARLLELAAPAHDTSAQTVLAGPAGAAHAEAGARRTAPGWRGSRRRAPEPALVTLRLAAAGRPLFLAADATGVASSYRTLAESLDIDRPIHGLSADEVPRQAFPRIEAIATSHIQTLLRTAPGPYTIGGWSFGAVVAHEMARQLTALGQEVDALVLLDGYAPDRAGRPIASAPAFLAGNLRLQLQAALGVGGFGSGLRRFPDLRRRFVANIGALLRYRPRPVPCPAVVFRAGVDRSEAARLRHELSTLYTDVRVHPVPGDHWSILAEPAVRDLAEKLREALAGGRADLTGGG